MTRPTNALRCLEDYQAALAGAAALGWNDNTDPTRKLRPPRKGREICELLLVADCWSKPDERRFKIAYLGGFEFKALLYRQSRAATEPGLSTGAPSAPRAPRKGK